ncbi:fatty acyl-CoA synthetase [Ornithinimicrobium faecis]|uniref:Fatty acyl-CoA synthetase n=1 Tax=Ornithinimicrobium faecis TaxID=2934158 RepID=A0ABY4YTN6_9MICO|nr:MULTISPECIES: fatty acyl-CoA synthetase [unclassified Ornithinimicrobium]USQ80139.1 fatty acyl-CoA synthetase [Ornithinimicrobium sp. HY1793]
MSLLTRSSTVDGVLRRSAARYDGATALTFADRTWSYAELDGAVSRVAAHLLGLGLTKGDRVAALGRNSDAYLIAFLACARAGLVHVPLNYNLLGGELDYLLAQSGSTALLLDPALEGSLGGVQEQTLAALAHQIPLRDAESSVISVATEGPVPIIDAEVADEDLVQLLYTSGTTSRPKGAMMSHKALVHEYLSCIVELDLATDDNPLHVMPLYHSAQMHVFLLPWLAIGATNTVLEVPDPAEVLRRIGRDGHRAFFAAPTLWVAVVNHGDFEGSDLSGLRKAYYGASIMPGPVLKRLLDKAPDCGFYNCFGQSEVAPLTCVLRPEDHADRPDSAGKPALFVEARVVDAQGHDVAPGESGEIVYRSPQLCAGYWDNAPATAEAFADGWFHSGDLVRVDDEGYVFVVDRIKDVINTGGVLVASREVEDAIYTHPAVAEVAVVGVPDEKWVEAIAAFVVRKGEVDEAGIVEHVRSHLAAFKVPKRVTFIDDLPRNASGKILKRELRDATP